MARYLFMLVLSLSLLSCRGKGASVEETLKEGLNEHLRITNDVLYERGKKLGKGTTIKIGGPVKVSVGKDNKTAVMDTVIEMHYATENKTEKVPIRMLWKQKDGSWSAEDVLPEDYGFIIAFSEKTIKKIKR